MDHHLHTLVRAAAAAAIGLHALVGGAQEPAPSGRVGDAWTYLRQDGKTYTEWIKETHPQSYTVANGKDSYPYDTALERTYAVEDGGALQEPRRVDFPLRVGNAWKASYRVQEVTGLWRQETAARKVTDKTWIKVAAGAFEAYRIDATVRFVRDDPSALPYGVAGGLREETYWYAPAVKRIVRYDSATLLHSIGGDFLERDWYELAALHLPDAPAWSPLPDGSWPVSVAASDGRTHSVKLTVKDQRAVWEGFQTGIPGCPRLAAPVEFKETADGGALMHVMRSLASEGCSDLHFQLTRTARGTWSGTGVAAGSLVIETAR